MLLLRPLTPSVPSVDIPLGPRCSQGPGHTGGSRDRPSVGSPGFDGEAVLPEGDTHSAVCLEAVVRSEALNWP